MQQGFIFVWRKLMESNIWMDKPSWWLKIWEYILFKVNHAPNKKFPRGQNFFNRGMIYYDCCLYNDNVKETSIKNIIDWLKKERMITTQKTTRGMIITVLNYETYQPRKEHRKDTEQHTARNSQGTLKEHRKDTINNNVNNENNERKEIKLIATEIKNWFEIFWQQYPRKLYKKRTIPVFFEKIRTDRDWEKLKIALTNYNKSKDVEDGTIMNAYNWLENWEDWVNYKEPKKRTGKLTVEDL